MVDAYAGHQLVTFMNIFSGYNQVFMHHDDQEKIAFVTEHGTYCYKVMPFGLKNVGATYQMLEKKSSRKRSRNSLRSMLMTF